MEIHKYEHENLGHLEEFSRTVFEQHEDLFQDIKTSLYSSMNQGVYTIENKEGLVVMATTHQSIWHPFCIYVRLVYQLNSVPSEALQKMVAYLMGQYKLPLFFLFDERFEGLGKVLQSSGLRNIRKTELININIQIQEAKAVRNKKGVAISNIVHDTNLMKSLIELCKTCYRKTHLANPVGHFSLENWESIVMDELVLENSYVVLKNKQVVAFSLMYDGEDAVWELGWVGVDERSPLELLDMLIAQQLEDALRLGIKTIEKEVDSTCSYSLHIAKSVAYEVSETFFAYKS